MQHCFKYGFFAVAIAIASASTVFGFGSIERLLEKQQYQSVNFDRCEFSFSREFEPSATNGFFSRVSTTIFLDQLSERSNHRIVMRPTQSGEEVFILTWPFDAFSAQQNRTRADLELKLKTQFPMLRWPYPHPKFHDSSTPLVETVIRETVEDIANWSRTTTFAEFGPSTSFPTELYLIADNQNDLRLIVEKLSELIQSSGC